MQVNSDIAVQSIVGLDGETKPTVYLDTSICVNECTYVCMQYIFVCTYIGIYIQIEHTCTIYNNI